MRRTQNSQGRDHETRPRGPHAHEERHERGQRQHHPEAAPRRTEHRLEGPHHEPCRLVRRARHVRVVPVLPQRRREVRRDEDLEVGEVPGADRDPGGDDGAHPRPVFGRDRVCQQRAEERWSHEELRVRERDADREREPERHQVPRPVAAAEDGRPMKGEQGEERLRAVLLQQLGPYDRSGIEGDRAEREEPAERADEVPPRAEREPEGEPAEEKREEPQRHLRGQRERCEQPEGCGPQHGRGAQREAKLRHALHACRDGDPGLVVPEAVAAELPDAVGEAGEADTPGERRPGPALQASALCHRCSSST